MTIPNRNLITKGIFAVSVVAITAVVGAIGFAKAAPGQALSSGYGNTGDLIRAAAADFQAAVQSAQSSFIADINNCITGITPSTAATNFQNRNNAAINALRSTANNPSTLSQSPTQLATTMTAAQATATGQLSANNIQLMAELDRTTAAAKRTAIQQCLATARTSFRDKIQDARQTFIDAIKSIIGR